MGGVKKSLKKYIGRANLSFEELQTLVVEVGAVITACNARLLVKD